MALPQGSGFTLQVLAPLKKVAVGFSLQSLTQNAFALTQTIKILISFKSVETINKTYKPTKSH